MSYRLWPIKFLFWGVNLSEVWLIVFLKLSCNTLKKKGIVNSITHCRRICKTIDFGNRVCPSHWRPPVYVDEIWITWKLWDISKRSHTGTEAREVLEVARHSERQHRIWKWLELVGFWWPGSCGLPWWHWLAVMRWIGFGPDVRINKDKFRGKLMWETE